MSSPGEGTPVGVECVGYRYTPADFEPRRWSRPELEWLPVPGERAPGFQLADPSSDWVHPPAPAPAAPAVRLPGAAAWAAAVPLRGYAGATGGGPSWWTGAGGSWQLTWLTGMDASARSPRPPPTAWAPGYSSAVVYGRFRLLEPDTPGLRVRTSPGIDPVGVLVLPVWRLPGGRAQWLDAHGKLCCLGHHPGLSGFESGP